MTTSSKRSWSLGFLADAHGEVYKRVKLGDDTYYLMGDDDGRLQSLNEASEPLQDALNHAQIFSNDLANPESRATETRPTSSGLPSSNPAPEKHDPAASSNARGRKRTRNRAKRPNKEKPAPKLPNPLPGRSPSPSGDLRIPLWRKETRAFKGECELWPKLMAKELAESAQEAELWVDGKPQFNIFADGSYKLFVELPRGTKKGLKEHQMWGHGGYAVAFRDPYFREEEAPESDNNDNDDNDNKTKKKKKRKKKKKKNDKSQAEVTEETAGAVKTRLPDFTSRAWNSHCVLSSYQTELAAIFQALQIALTSVRQNRPPSGAYVCIYTDSTECVNRLRNKRAMADGKPVRLRNALTMQLVRAIVWLSYCLAEEGCEVTVRWLPRCCVQGHKLAHKAATSWRKKGTEFHERDSPLWRRDGIMDALHKDLMKVVGQINADIQARLPSQSGSKKGDGGDEGDMLEKFSGSAVQKEIERQSEVMDMPSGADQKPEPDIVNEDGMDELQGS